MREALARHDALLREAIKGHGRGAGMTLEQAVEHALEEVPAPSEAGGSGDA